MTEVYIVYKQNQHSKRKIPIEMTRHKEVAKMWVRTLTTYGMGDADFTIKTKEIEDERKEDKEKGS